MTTSRSEPHLPSTVSGSSEEASPPFTAIPVSTAHGRHRSMHLCYAGGILQKAYRHGVAVELEVGVVCCVRSGAVTCSRGKLRSRGTSVSEEVHVLLLIASSQECGRYQGGRLGMAG